MHAHYTEIVFTMRCTAFGLVWRQQLREPSQEGQSTKERLRQKFQQEANRPVLRCCSTCRLFAPTPSLSSACISMRTAARSIPPCVLATVHLYQNYSCHHLDTAIKGIHVQVPQWPIRLVRIISMVVFVHPLEQSSSKWTTAIGKRSSAEGILPTHENNKAVVLLQNSTCVLSTCIGDRKGEVDSKYTAAFNSATTCYACFWSRHAVVSRIWCLRGTC